MKMIYDEGITVSSASRRLLHYFSFPEVCSNIDDVLTHEDQFNKQLTMILFHIISMFSLELSYLLDHELRVVMTTAPSQEFNGPV